MLKIHSNSLQRVEKDSDLEKFNGKIVAYITDSLHNDEYQIREVMFAHVFRGEKHFHIDPLKQVPARCVSLYNLSSYKDLTVRLPTYKELTELEEKAKREEVVFCAYVHPRTITEQLEETCKREFWANFSVREYS